MPAAFRQACRHCRGPRRRMSLQAACLGGQVRLPRIPRGSSPARVRPCKVVADPAQFRVHGVRGLQPPARPLKPPQRRVAALLHVDAHVAAHADAAEMRRPLAAGAAAPHRLRVRAHMVHGAVGPGRLRDKPHARAPSAFPASATACENPGRSAPRCRKARRVSGLSRPCMRQGSLRHSFRRQCRLFPDCSARYWPRMQCLLERVCSNSPPGMPEMIRNCCKCGKCFLACKKLPDPARCA